MRDLDVLKTYSLTESHVRAVKKWAAEHGMSESAAVRYFIERAANHRPAIIAGIRRAKAAGVRCGRPRKYDLAADDVLALYAQGLSLSAIGRRLGNGHLVHPTIVGRILEMQLTPQQQGELQWLRKARKSLGVVRSSLRKAIASP